jgi:dihydroorotase-like cyclic amidohydrolase
LDLIVRNVRLANGFPGEPVDIGVAGGKIVAIERDLAVAAETMMRAGALPAPV